MYMHIHTHTHTHTPTHTHTHVHAYTHTHTQTQHTCTAARHAAASVSRKGACVTLSRYPRLCSCGPEASIDTVHICTHKQTHINEKRSDKDVSVSGTRYQRPHAH